MLGPRRKLACWICTRRKVKCDKQVPCNNCIRRGTTKECESDSTTAETPPHGREVSQQPSQSETSAVDALRKRVAELESTLQQNHADSNSAPISPANPLKSSSVAQPAAQERDTEIEDAATILEFLTWGRMKGPERTRLAREPFGEPRIQGHAINSPGEESIDSYLDTNKSLLSWLQLLLPQRRQLMQLVEYHNSSLLWFHDSYFVPTFLRQIEHFYREHHANVASPGLSLQWVALLFAVIAGTITSAPPSVARKCRFEETEARVLSRKWYKAVICSLNAADYAANHSIYSVQAIATLTSTAHILGHSNSQSVMLAAAIRIAQSLGLHRLDEDARGDDVELETGRRLWAQLCTQDWFSTSFSETYSIHPLHSTSSPPRNCSDDLKTLPNSIPTIVSFCWFLAEAASIMPRLQDGMASSNTLYTKYEQVLLYDKKIRFLATEGRPSFLSNTELDETWPHYIPWARRAVAMSFAHKIIMIHRKFLSLSFINPAFTFTRRTCLAASRTILKEYIAIDGDEASPMLWTHQAFSVAACIIICLDLLHQQQSTAVIEEAESNNLVVTQTIEILGRSQERSMIAARGVKLLTALQKQIRESTDSSRKRRNDDTNNLGSSSRKRHVSFDVVEFARSFSDSDIVTQARPTVNDTDRRSHGMSGSARDTPQDLEEEIQVIEGISGPLDATHEDVGGFLDMSMMDFNGSQSFENLMILATQDLQ